MARCSNSADIIGAGGCERGEGHSGLHRLGQAAWPGLDAETGMPDMTRVFHETISQADADLGDLETRHDAERWREAHARALELMETIKSGPGACDKRGHEYLWTFVLECCGE